MPCFHPIPAWQFPNIKTENGKSTISFKDPFAPPSPDRVAIQVPCGKCVGCRTAKTREWAVRCVHESQLYEHNCFITLTFSPLFENPSGSLMKKDFQNFMKRLRKKFGAGIRFYHCGEYGERGDRPHHHACIFNFDFPDKELVREKDGVRLYRSEILERLWSVEIPAEMVPCFDRNDVYEEREKFYAKQGFCTVGDVTSDSAAYVAGYVLKKLKEDPDERLDRVKSYTTMSRRPGIGKDWIRSFHTDVYPSDEVVMPGGMVLKPPRFYDKFYETISKERYDALVKKRLDFAKDNPHNSDIRLRVREKVALAKHKTKVRSFEID